MLDLYQLSVIKLADKNVPYLSKKLPHVSKLLVEDIWESPDRLLSLKSNGQAITNSFSFLPPIAFTSVLSPPPATISGQVTIICVLGYLPGLTTSPLPSPNHCPHGNLVANFLHTYRSQYFKHPVTSWRGYQSSPPSSSPPQTIICAAPVSTTCSPLLVTHATSRHQVPGTIPIRSPFHGSHYVLIFHICHVAHFISVYLSDYLITSFSGW